MGGGFLLLEIFFTTYFLLIALRIIANPLPCLKKTQILEHYLLDYFEEGGSVITTKKI